MRLPFACPHRFCSQPIVRSPRNQRPLKTSSTTGTCGRSWRKTVSFCHGADSATREAGLRLDIREDAVEFGAILPGESADSSLVERIFLADDDDLRMPPLASHK